MTDNEIIKALHCCIADDCDNCKHSFGNCQENLMLESLSLINSQKAEIERLNNSAKQWEDTAKDLFIGKQTAKAEAIKEFAEMVKRYIDVGHLRPPTEICFSELDVVSIIDNLVKEMVGEIK